MDAQVYLNGQFVPRAAATLDVTDRGALFADGVYEVLRVYGGRMFEAPAHLDRLRQSLAGIALAEPVDTAKLPAISEELIRRNACPEAKVYWQVTRGSTGGRDFEVPRGVKPTVLALTEPMKPVDPILPPGQRVLLISDPRWSRCDLKTLMLLPAVLAQEEARKRGLDAAVFHRGGNVTEGSSFNVLIVRDGELWTPPADNDILDGVTRRFVLAMALKLGIPARETPVSLEAFMAADEAMMCSTTRQVVPITEAGGRRIGDGAPGPVTEKLHEGFMAAVRSGPVAEWPSGQVAK